MRHFFEFEKYHTSCRQESVAGITTFLTMAYIIIANPAILENAGIPRGPQVTATIFAAVLGTAIMVFWAKRPFAIAPCMSTNAFVVFVVVKVMTGRAAEVKPGMWVLALISSSLYVFLPKM